MARTKKEKTVDAVENQETVAIEQATVENEAKKTQKQRKPRVTKAVKDVKEVKEAKDGNETEEKDSKKTVRRAKKIVQKKKEEPKKEERLNPALEQPLGTEFTVPSEEKTENSVEGKTLPKKPVEKAKRGRKPTKKTEEPTVKEGRREETKLEDKPSETKKTVSRAEKNAAIRGFVKEKLSVRAYKWSELLEEIAKGYLESVDAEEAKNANDLRGRIGSVVDVMKKEGEVVFDGGMYALKSLQTEKNEPKKLEESPKEVAIETEKTEEKPQEREEQPQEKSLPAVKEPAKLSPVFDMSLLLGKADDKKRVGIKPIDEGKQDGLQAAEETAVKPAQEEKVEPKKERTTKKTPKTEEKKKPERRTQKSADEKLKESFLKKVRSLGGVYFEYYSVYLLERYSLRNGRRVDGMRVSGGEYDGGIDGEISVTDRIGFKETIYIQAKNWNPMSGKDEGWVVGETILQQFIGAVAYRQAKEGIQHCRGIFVTTSYFTSGAKEMLSKMSDKFVGYDGDDLFEAAKECSFGLIQKDGQWVLDEKLLSGEKAFFNLY